MEEPLTAASDGRQPGGRFGPGNKFGKGNPHLRRAAALRAAALDAVTEDDMRAIFERLVLKAKVGDLGAAKLVLEHVIGRPVAYIKLDVEGEGPHPFDLERQRRFTEDPEYAALVMAVEHYELRHGIDPGAAMLEQAERELDGWRRRKTDEIDGNRAGPPGA
jgi:hypothetical protein